MVLRCLLYLVSSVGTLITWTAVGLSAPPAELAESTSLAERPESAWLTVNRELGAEACPDGVTLMQLSERLLDGKAPELQVHVAFSHEQDTFIAEITRPGRDGMRRLSDSFSDCSALAGAVATVLALWVDNESVETPPQAPLPLAPPPEPAHRLAPASPQHAVGVSIAGGLSLAYFDEATPTVAGEFFYLFKRLRLSLGALHFFSRTTHLAPGSVSHRVTAGSASVCVRVVGNDAFALTPCVGTKFGVMTVEAQGFTDDSKERRPWLTFPLGLAASGRLATSNNFHWGWRVGASALIASRQEEFVIEGIGPAFQTGRVSALLEAGIEGAFSF